MSISPSWEGEGRYGSFPFPIERVGVQVSEHVPYLSASEVMIHEQALHQVYIPLPLYTNIIYIFTHTVLTAILQVNLG